MRNTNHKRIAGSEIAMDEVAAPPRTPGILAHQQASSAEDFRIAKPTRSARLPGLDPKSQRLEQGAFLGLALSAGVLIVLCAANSMRFATHQEAIAAALCVPAPETLQPRPKLAGAAITDDKMHHIW